MKTFLRISLLSLTIISLFSCEQNQNSSTQSSVAQIISFAFASNDSIPGLGEATFVVEQLNDTGLIRMRKNDSIRCGTSLKAVVPQITYYTTPSAVRFYLGNKEIALTGYDTLNLDFNNDSIPIKIHVYAQNSDYSKWYRLRFDVHTMDGDLFKWDTLTSAITDVKQGTQKALMRKGKFYYYQSDGYKVHLFTSSDQGETWSKETGLTNLPDNCNVRQIVEGDLYFFYGKGHDFYYSGDGIAWEHTRIDTLDIMALYMCMNVKNNTEPDDTVRLWLAARDAKGAARFYTVGKDVTPRVAKGIGLKGDTLPLNFPVEDFATIPFESSSTHHHGLIAGGYDRTHEMTNSRWNLEYNHIYNTYHITNMAKGDSSIPAFTGTSVSYYNKYMYMLGGFFKGRIFLKNAYVSDNEGKSWTEVTDSTNSKRPEGFNGRYHTNTFVHNNNLYIIGGEDNSTTYSDVYRGRQNSIGWEPIGN